MTTDKITKEEIKNLINNKLSRIRMTTESHKWFFNVYFGHYITYPAADFHHKMFFLTEDESITTLGIIAFRGSAKSTIFTLSYPIWAILGKQQKKFVIILGETQRQAKQHLVNIKKELESNELLRSDLGPFKEVDDEWGSYSLVIPKYNARITAASMEQTIRGMRHKQYRPDLIICDDIEDLNNVRTKEGRDKVYNWITGEVVPAGDHNTRIIFIGNLLHEDSLLMRVKDKIEIKELDGRFYEIPLIDENNKIAWPGKFPDMDYIEKEKKKIGNEVSWHREYLLEIISDEGRIIHPEWIQHYDSSPDFKNENFRYSATGIDLAISQKTSADYTAMVSAHVFGYDENLKIFIVPNPTNERLTHKQTLDTAMEISKALGKGNMTTLFVEDVAYQKSVVQELVRYKYPAESAYVHGKDKYSRLKSISHLIQDGTIVFPRKGCEMLINQCINFGVERHNDLADAFSLLINAIMSQDNEEPSLDVILISSRSERKIRGLSDSYDD